MENGETLRLSYAAKSGHEYQSIGRIMTERGVFTSDNVSMQSLRNWMQENPQAGRELMWQNPSYIFFREIKIPDDTLGALGAGRVHLTPLRSMAVDKDYFHYGTPMWLATENRENSKSNVTNLSRLMIAQDTGSAIKGMSRGDVYWGWGEEAAWNAGHMRSEGSLTVLLPHAVVKRLGLE